MYDISLARPSDIPYLPGIELAAARLLVGHAPESVLTEATSLEEFEAAQTEGRLGLRGRATLPSVSRTWRYSSRTALT